MQDSHLLEGIELYKIIPQRPPIVEIDTLYECTEDSAHTGLMVREDNFFYENGCLQESGLIEHIAQSAAAFAGYSTFLLGKEPRLGFIGEIKKCKVHRLVKLNESLHTYIEIVSQVDTISLIKAKTLVEEEVVVECQMKIFIKEED